MAGKYWETEKPEVLETSKNQIRVYVQNGKIQVFPKVSSAPNGIGKGATIDLESMTVDELKDFLKLLDKALTEQLSMA